MYVIILTGNAFTTFKIGRADFLEAKTWFQWDKDLDQMTNIQWGTFLSFHCLNASEALI